MSTFLTSSIGKKFIMSITGFFLMTFLVVHLSLNLLLLVGDGTLFNLAAHFMVSNPIIKVVEPILGLGFIVHIIYASYITLQNRLARPQSYNQSSASDNSSWPSRNMYILGGLIFVFLVMHIVNFYWKLKFGEAPEVVIDGVHMHDTYALVSGLFMEYWWYDILYMVGAVFLGLHLLHGFWSAFQTLGWSNIVWKKRLGVIGNIYSFVIAGGFFIIPLYFLIFK